METTRNRTKQIILCFKVTSRGGSSTYGMLLVGVKTEFMEALDVL